MTRKIILVCCTGILLILAMYAYNIYQNNRQITRPDQSQMEQALDKSINWLYNNRDKINTVHNPALWWMLKESADIAGKDRLTVIYRDYKTTYLDKNPANIWTPYFNKYYRPVAPDISSLQGFRDYQVFFTYALSCDNELGLEPLVQKQLQPDFCNLHYLFPRCVTHQQMGVRLMQERNCGDTEALSILSEALTEMIQSEITWDFRVGDAYLQRVLTLAEAGKIAAIKPVWIKRILDAQNPDGGWDDIHPIISLGDRALGYSSTLPVLRRTSSTFHATAQGIWLMSLLLNQQHSSTANDADSP